FDTSYKTVRLALVSLDDGGCEAVAEQADGPRVISVLQQAAAENQVPLQNLGVQSDKQRQGVTQTAFSLTLAGRPMHILAVTA
ncbi:hypothetical protein AAEJ42_23180, partial [Shewanella algae]|uniref:hypothetical protein n=1 Tax=Shewanella algae TaxID=38313 RepID=UPI00313DBBC4